MATSRERREVARKLRAKCLERSAPNRLVPRDALSYMYSYMQDLNECLPDGDNSFKVLADLIEPEHEPDREWERWLDGLHHEGKPRSVRDELAEVVWAACTVDMGPNGNTDPSTGADEGVVGTDALRDAWEREIRGLACPGRP